LVFKNVIVYIDQQQEANMKTICLLVSIWIMCLSGCTMSNVAVTPAKVGIEQDSIEATTQPSTSYHIVVRGNKKEETK